MNWQELAATSHYRTAVAVANELADGNVAEATAGLEELIDAVARAERRALRSQLVRLMTHVLKWINQPEKRSASWAVTILQARDEIVAIREEVPSLTRKKIEAMWVRCFASAVRQAELEMGHAVKTTRLSWHQVFTADYRIDLPDKPVKSKG